MTRPDPQLAEFFRLARERAAAERAARAEQAQKPLDCGCVLCRGRMERAKAAQHQTKGITK